jgi:hypothetical protein
VGFLVMSTEVETSLTIFFDKSKLHNSGRNDEAHRQNGHEDLQRRTPQRGVPTSYEYKYSS